MIGKEKERLEVGKKFRIKGGELKVEVVSIRPGSQGVRFAEDGVDYYEVMLNGAKVLISEVILNALIKAGSIKDEEVKPKI